MTRRFDPIPETLHCLQVGPLGPHIESFAYWLSERGFCRDIGWAKVKLAAELSRWLQRRRIKLRQLDERHTTAFLRARWKQG